VGIVGSDLMVFADLPTDRGYVLGPRAPTRALWCLPDQEGRDAASPLLVVMPRSKSDQPAAIRGRNLRAETHAQSAYFRGG